MSGPKPLGGIIPGAPYTKPSMRTPPENDIQPDFFVPSLYDVATKDNRSLMDVALFRLSKRDKRAGEVIRYDLPDGFVEVKAGPDGMASIWDYDIVLMLISHLTESMNLFKAGRGAMPGRKFVPYASDIAKFCRRGDGGRQADELEAALDRLLGTTIKSVREKPSANGKRMIRETEAESLIGPYRVVSRTDTGKVSSVEIEAPNWIYSLPQLPRLVHSALMREKPANLQPVLTELVRVQKQQNRLLSFLVILILTVIGAGLIWWRG